jgi:hypothetical protein
MRVGMTLHGWLGIVLGQWCWPLLTLFPGLLNSHPCARYPSGS